MKDAAQGFLQCPYSPMKRQDMVRTADALLSAVNRMLYIADIADALKLQASLRLVDVNLQELDVSRNTEDLIRSFRRLGNDLLTVTNLAGDVEDMNNPERSIDLENACDTLRKSGLTLKSAPKMYSEKPGLHEVRDDFYGVLQQVIGATNIVSKVLNPNHDGSSDIKEIVNDIITHLVQAGNHSTPQKTEVAVQIFKFSNALEEIDDKINICSCIYSDPSIRTNVERGLNKVIKEAAVLADFDGIKETVRTSLFQACFKATDTVRNAIAKIHDGDSDDEDEIDENQRQIMVGIAREATKDLRKCIMDGLLDHISFKYKGIEKLLNPGLLLSEEQTKALHEYVDAMKEVSRLTGYLSEDQTMKDDIDIALKRLSFIRKDVMATSQVLANTKKRLTTCRDSWQNNVSTLKKAVTSVNNEGLTRENPRQHTEKLQVPKYNRSVSNQDDSYWWDTTTDEFTTQPSSSSSGDFLESSLEDLATSEDSKDDQYSELLSERIADQYERRLFRATTPQPPGYNNNYRLPGRVLYTPQPIRRCSSQLSEPYSPHPRRRNRSMSVSHNSNNSLDFHQLHMAVSDMQINLAPKLANVLTKSQSVNNGKCGTCNNEAHTTIIDSLKLVYKGIQNICTALLDEEQFAKPDFALNGESELLSNNKEPDNLEKKFYLNGKQSEDDYFDKEFFVTETFGPKQWVNDKGYNGQYLTGRQETTL